MSRLNPMCIAPNDGTEILAFHTKGNNFHQVKWKDFTGGWGMRWNEDYLQHNCDYSGWIHIPEVDDT